MPRKKQDKKRPGKKGTKAKIRTSEAPSLAHPGARSLPAAGTALIGRYRGTEHRARVIEEGGGLRVRLGADTYRSLSAAAKAITGSNVNGWRFWSIP